MRILPCMSSKPTAPETCSGSLVVGVGCGFPLSFNYGVVRSWFSNMVCPYFTTPVSTLRPGVVSIAASTFRMAQSTGSVVPLWVYLAFSNNLKWLKKHETSFTIDQSRSLASIRSPHHRVRSNWADEYYPVRKSSKLAYDPEIVPRLQVYCYVGEASLWTTLRCLAPCCGWSWPFMALGNTSCR